MERIDELGSAMALAIFEQRASMRFGNRRVSSVYYRTRIKIWAALLNRDIPVEEAGK